MFIYIRIIFLLLLFTRLIVAELIPVGRPGADITYNYARELYLRGYLETANLLIAPIDYSEIASLSATGKPACANRLITSLQDMSGQRTDIGNLTIKTAIIPHGVYNDDAQHTYLALMPELCYRISDSWSIQTAYRVDGALVDDSLYTGKKWDNFAGYAELAAISYRGKRLAIDLGRSRHAWGIAGGGNSLFLSAAAFPLDGISF
jgi:hypothetical protein